MGCESTMTFDRLDIPNRIVNIQTYANRHGAALGLNPAFHDLNKYDQANILDNAVDAIEERIESRGGMMATERERQRIIGSILWTSGKMFVGNSVSTAEDEGIESDHPGLVVKNVDGSEFHITIVQVI